MSWYVVVRNGPDPGGKTFGSVLRDGMLFCTALSNAQPFSREEAEGWLIKIGAPWYPQIVDRDELETIQIVRELAD